MRQKMKKLHRFQSTHPVRGATRDAQGVMSGDGFQSTHPVRGATRAVIDKSVDGKFQSTHPVRGATMFWTGSPLWRSFQSTHPVRGATQAALAGRQGQDPISIHAPRAGCDLSLARLSGLIHTEFQSTHPVRGATTTSRFWTSSTSIFQSTHPVRGATGPDTQDAQIICNFNPRTPCGVRP